MRRFLLTLLAAPLLVIFMFIGEGFASGNLTQNSSRECAICHFRWIDQFVEGHGTALAKYETEDVAGVEMMCFSCHDGSTVDSRSMVWLLDKHKTGMKPSDKVKIPKLFPLSHSGEMVCATCHSAHSNPTDISIERSVFLRITDTDSIMCEMCHVDQIPGETNHPVHEGKKPLPDKIFAVGATPAVEDRNHVICESCHNAHGGVEKNLIYTLSESALCIICHAEKIDDTSAPALKQKNHPLYEKFKPDQTSGLTLQSGAEGTLQCFSCHKIHQHAPRTKALVADRDTLCTICHPDKDDGALAPGPKTANHPLAVTFKTAPDSTVKLDGGDKNTVHCFTCHQIHQHAPGTKALAAKRNVLCSTCHADKYFIERTDHDLGITAPADKNINKQNSKQLGVCVSCHVPHKAAGPYLWSRPLAGKVLSTSDLCLSCHQENGTAAKKTLGQYSHPVNVKVKVQKDSQLPLHSNKNGQSVMECHTCHDPHQWQADRKRKGQGKNIEGDGTTSFLRQPAGKKSVLCSSCHADQFLVEGTDHDLAVTARKSLNITGKSVAQAGVCSACHIPHNAGGPMLWARSLTHENISASSLCLSCHIKNEPAAEKTVGKNSHRVGIAVSGSPRLPLIKKDATTSVMECSTCHNPHSWEPKAKHKGNGKNIEGDGTSSFLRKTNMAQAKLCSECHKQQGKIVGTDHDMRVTAPDSKNLNGQKPAQGSVCSSCHAVHNAAYQTVLWISDMSGNTEDFMERTCYGCHSAQGAGKNKLITPWSHPRRFYFGYNKPYSSSMHSGKTSFMELPLFDANGIMTTEGEITCPTCHDPHVWNSERIATGPGHNLEGTISNSFLRKEIRRGLCYQCHGIRTLFFYRYYHDIEKRKKMLRPYSPLK